jgi:carbonic anhydrase
MSKQWTEDVVYAARELNADCVIYCGHHSCKQTWSVVSILREELMKRAGLPLLILQGDSWIKRMTPMSVIQQEIDEFVKNVVAKKGTKKRRPRKRRKPGTGDEKETG